MGRHCGRYQIYGFKIQCSCKFFYYRYVALVYWIECAAENSYLLHYWVLCGGDGKASFGFRVSGFE